MRAPSIEMISASLRNCSLGRGRGAPSPAPPAEDSEGEGVMVELNSEVALPHQWEQCLDIRTGEVYYINWEDGTRTTEDPRTTTTTTTITHPASYYSDEEDDTSDSDSSSGGDGDNEGSDTGFSSCISSSLSSSASAPSPGEATSADPSGQILVAAGCKACFMYFMVPKRVEDCPKCGGLLFHLGRNGCF